MQKHIKLKISGRVQGVGFRFEAYQQFVDLGLKGKAENTKDGGVEIDVQGEEGVLVTFLEWVKQGPPGASVSNVEVVDIPVAAVEGKSAE